MEWTDDGFLDAFENCSLPASEFDHRGHLRLAWLYLERHPLQEAMQLTCDGIRKYAASLGAPGKFHRTLTEAIVRIMHGRRQLGMEKDFDRFLLNNPDLTENMKEVIGFHYSEKRLSSDDARAIFLPPDLRDL
jgi:N-formylglutamate deformylase